MACTTCYSDYISCGVETIEVKGTLLPDTDYTWILTSPTGAKYSGDVTTDADGKFELDVTSLPDDLLNPYAGIFTLQVQTADCSPASWNDSAYCDKYDCIQFVAVSGNYVKATLGCGCLEVNPDEMIYKVYTALLTQVGTAVPTAKVLENTLGATVTFARDGAGSYHLTASAAVFTVDKTYIVIASINDGGGVMVASWGSDTVISFATRDFLDFNTPVDDKLLDTAFEIRVYP